MENIQFSKKSIVKSEGCATITFESNDQALLIINQKQNKLKGTLNYLEKQAFIEKIMMPSNIKLNGNLKAIFISLEQKVIIYNPGLLGGGCCNIKHPPDNSYENYAIKTNRKIPEGILASLISSVKSGNENDIFCDLKKIIDQDIDQILGQLEEYFILKEILHTIHQRIMKNKSREDLLVHMCEFALKVFIRALKKHKHMHDDNLSHSVKVRIEKIQEELLLHERTLTYDKIRNIKKN